jgi:holo-[acyl-carrier protein] synthase
VILGIGNDVVEIERIEEAIKRNERFKERVYTKREIEYAEKNRNPFFVYSGRFAAKEAISKAFGTGIVGFNLTDIEILNNGDGKPYVVLHENAKERFGEFELMVTISHSKTVAMATAILIKS